MNLHDGLEQIPYPRACQSKLPDSLQEIGSAKSHGGLYPDAGRVGMGWACKAPYIHDSVKSKFCFQQASVARETFHSTLEVSDRASSLSPSNLPFQISPGLRRADHKLLRCLGHSRQQGALRLALAVQVDPLGCICLLSGSTATFGVRLCARRRASQLQHL